MPEGLNLDGITPDLVAVAASSSASELPRTNSTPSLAAADGLRPRSVSDFSTLASSVNSNWAAFNTIDWISFGYVFSETLAEVGDAPSDDCRTWHNWAQERGGTDSGRLGTFFHPSLQAAGAAAVLIDGIEVKVLGRGEPIVGVEVVCPTAGAELDPKNIQIDLDTDPPTVSYLREENGELVEANLAITVTESDLELLEVWAYTDDCDCEWIATLHFVAGGERGMLEITSNGDAFRTWGERNAMSYLWSDEWMPFGG